MERSRALGAMFFGIVVLVAGGGLSSWQHSFPVAAQATAATPNVAVGPQYDTTHVYVAPQDFDRFVASLIATFGGATTKQGVFTVTPTPSSTMSQLVLTPVGSISVFGFKTPIPYPFGLERTGYLVTRTWMRLSVWLAQRVRISSSPPSTTLLEKTPSSSGRAASTRSCIGIQLRPRTRH